jgi:hypothetical protein
MAEILKTTRYNDGTTIIPIVQGISDWSILNQMDGHSLKPYEKLARLLGRIIFDLICI